MKLDFNVGMVSLVGISGTFPRGHGNYFTTNYQGDQAMVVNLSHEDYEDAKRKGLLTGGVECKVFGYNGTYAIYVIDKRLPAKALEPFHTYFMPGPLVANVLRDAYGIDNYECIMKTNPELALKLSRSCSWDYDTKPGFVIKTITCGCCDKRHTLEPEVYERPRVFKNYTVEIVQTVEAVHGEEVENLLGN